jgi:pyridoxal biosynthesis lyase PdxS
MLTWLCAGRLPVVNFAAGGVATPADAALMMQLGKGFFPHGALILCELHVLTDFY